MNNDILAPLLTLSYDLAVEQNSSILFDKIFVGANKLLGVTSMKIDVLDEDKTSHHLVYDSAEKAKTPDEFKTAKYPVNNTVFERVFNSSIVNGITLNDFKSEEPLPGFLESWQQDGIELFYGIPLCVEHIGYGCLWLCMPPDFDDSMIRHFISQASPAISRIIRKEDRIKQDNEKSLLLEFSIAIATVKDKKGLADVIKQYLKSLGLIKEYGISVNADEHSFYHFLNDETAFYTGEQGFQNMKAEIFPLKRSLAEFIYKADRPVTSYMEDLIANKDIDHPYASFWLSVGINPITGIPLKFMGESFGILWIQPDKINDRLLTALAAQIAIAVSNIIAIDKMKERELEKTLLLSFSNSLARVRNREELADLLEDNLRRIFHLSDFIITIRDEETSSAGYFVHDKHSSINSFFEQKKIFLESTVEHPIYHKITGSEQPVFINLKEFSHLETIVPTPALWLSQEQHFVSGTNLKVGQRGVGVLWTIPGQASDELLVGICSQIAIALANVSANEKIQLQLDEINVYKQQLELENLYLHKEIYNAGMRHEIVGDDPEIQKIFRLISQVAFTNSTVLLTGETGTGKELIAKAIHNSSPRKDKLMIKVNCATLPATLIESELFGHEKGSFTGAYERRIGKFELANHGTLFLDEIGEMPLELQGKLLRALQEKEIERLGGQNVIKVDVRIIAATNRDLLKEVQEGRFRRDLYYRLNVFPIHLPALRDRKRDIPVLASHFLQKNSQSIGKRMTSISAKALNTLTEYNWPGNIRELEHLIERSILMNEGPVLEQISLPDKEVATSVGKSFELTTLEENERAYILYVLEYCKWKVSGPSGAAVLLGVPASTLNSRIKKLGIERKHQG